MISIYAYNTAFLFSQYGRAMAMLISLLANSGLLAVPSAQAANATTGAGTSSPVSQGRNDPANDTTSAQGTVNAGQAAAVHPSASSSGQHHA